VLVASGGDVSRGFPSDSALEAQRRDSLERIRVADSVAQAAAEAAQAAREARARRADSLAAARPDTARPRPTRPAPARPAPAVTPRDSAR
jgi:hypothetical protein